MVPIQNENDGKVLGVLTEGTFVLTPLSLVLSSAVLSVPPLPILFLGPFIRLLECHYSIFPFTIIPPIPCILLFAALALLPSHRSYQLTHHHTGNLTSMMTQGRIQPEEMCVGAMYKQFRQVQLSTSLCELANIFDRSVREHDTMLREGRNYTGIFLEKQSRGQERRREKRSREKIGLISLPSVPFIQDVR